MRKALNSIQLQYQIRHVTFITFLNFFNLNAKYIGSKKCVYVAFNVTDMVQRDSVRILTYFNYTY